MNYEEKEMQVRFGKENPFRVPEGYFDQLADRVMAQLPERDQQAEQVTLSNHRPKSRLVTLRPWLYAAACTIAVVVMGITFYSHETADEQSLASTSITAAVAANMIRGILSPPLATTIIKTASASTAISPGKA